jgi:hypothetical protein
VGSSVIDCEEAGLNVNSGDRVSTVAFGIATGSDVGGLARGIEGQGVFVRCRNTTTDEEITFASNNLAFSCVRRGLQVQSGDRLVMIVRGSAL